jgi:hypothetical protein
MNTHQHYQLPYAPYLGWHREDRPGIASAISSFRLTKRVIISSVASVIWLSLASLSLYEMHALPFVHMDRASAAVVSTAVPQSAPLAHAAVPVGVKPQTQEMHIANNGLVLLRGATVESNENGVLRITMSWGGADFTWSLDTDAKTEYYRSNGELGTLADIQPGQVVTVTGMLTKGGALSTVQAEYIHE